MKLDVAAVRACYPALADGYAYLDGAAGTQVPVSVIEAIGQAQAAGLGNAGGAFPASERTDAITAACRAAVAALTGGDADGVILGPNMTTLTYRVAGTLAKDWKPGDEIVVSRLDHDANVRPWVQAAERAGATVRWAAVDPATGELPAGQYRDLITERTRLVAVTAASNIIGTRPDVPAITRLAREAGALSYVDGVHATPHVPVDVHVLGADFYVTSAYKWSGPHIGAVVADPALLEGLRPDKLKPAPDTVPDRFELGTLPFASLAGVTAAVLHLASLAELPGTGQGGNGADPGAASLRGRILTSMTAVSQHEQELFEVMLAGAGQHAARADLRPRRQPDGDRVLHGQGPHSAAGSRVPGQPEGQCLERRQLCLRADRSARHQGTSSAVRGQAWSITTTAPRSTACSPPWPSSRPASGRLPAG